MDYREKLRPGKRVNAFYPELDYEPEPLPGVQPPDAKRVYLYDWDDKKQKVVGKWVDTTKK